MLKYHIKTVDVTADTGAVLFNNLPTDYDELYVSYSFRHTGTGENAYPWSPLYIAVNGGSPDLFKNLYGFTDATGSDTNSNFPMGADTSATANIFSIGDFTIFNANNSNTKPAYGVSATENNAGPALNYTNAAHFSVTEAIRSISIYAIFNQIAAGSFVSVYGIKRGLNNIAQISPVVSGNTITTTSGGYTYVAFNSSGLFTSPLTTTADVLVVGGGGSGGGGDIGGGGGAGGYVASTSVSLVAGTTYPVIIGAGGSTANYAVQGFNGSHSSFNTISAIGGGAGGTRNSTNNGLQNGVQGASGGGGGGAIYNTATGGSGTSPQGNNGGAGYISGDGNAAGGGGGGATAAGTNGSYSTGGAGGAGTAWVNGTYYAGGGGGAGNTGGAGGNGGGGAGYRGQAPVAGRQNTGGGGGGAGGIGGYNNGGSGVVIIRYVTPA